MDYSNLYANPEFQAYLQGMFADISKQYELQKENVAQQQARAGVYTSPYGQKPLDVLSEAEAAKKASIGSELGYKEFGALRGREWNQEDTAQQLKNQEALLGIQQNFATKQAEMQRAWDKEDWVKYENLSRDLAEIQKPKEKQWWEYFASSLPPAVSYYMASKK